MTETLIVLHIHRKNLILDRESESVQQEWREITQRDWTRREDKHLRHRFIEDSAAYSDIASELDRPLGEVVKRARELNLWDEYCAKKLSELNTKMLPKDGSKCLCGFDVPPDGRFCSSCGRFVR